MKKLYLIVLFGWMLIFLAACNFEVFTSGNKDKQDQPPQNQIKKPTNQDENKQPTQNEEQPPVTNEKSIETIVTEYFQVFNIHDAAKEQVAQQFFDEYLVSSTASEALTAWKSNAKANVPTTYYDYKTVDQVEITGYDTKYPEAKAVLVELSSNNPNDNGRAFVVFVNDGGRDKIYQTIGETHVEFFNQLVAYFPNETPSRFEGGDSGDNKKDSEGIPYGDFLVTDHFYDADDQNEYVAGSIVNTSDYYYTFVEVEVALQDESGNILGYSYANIEMIGPGELWEFEAIVTELEASYYEIINIFGDKKEFGKSNIYFDEELQLLAHSAYIEGTSTFVVGTVENISDYDFTYVEVLVDLYDGSGNYLGFAWATTDNLPPGATWEFETTLDVEAVNYDIVHLIGW